MRNKWKQIGQKIAAHVLAFTCIASGLSVGSAIPATAQEKTAFSDTSGHWASREIAAAVTSGLVRGFPDGTFRPDQSITQEEFLAIVERIIPSYPGRNKAQLEQTSYMARVKGRWSEGTYLHLLSAGIMASGNPGDSLDRLEGARIMLAALGQQSEGEKYRATKSQFFPDLPVENTQAVMIAYPAYKLGMMTGYPDGTFRPKEKVSRAQAVVLASRLKDKIAELFPGDVSEDERRKMANTVANFVKDALETQKIRRFDELVGYVQERNLPVSEKFLQEHFSFLKYELYDPARMPQFNELIYYARIGRDKYRMTVQYYGGEGMGSMDRTFYLSSADSRTFRLIGKDE
ncbi:S-layer homology domain-containing protein [Brevibacillus sp. TJ4]|uniref:S-layer homology domain-containing protein n=1 Tax=Brevibacillus sp. TJ4 TaxID=3234853 RepID=UPI0037CDEB2D